jgi:predicted lipoprotein
MTDAKVNDQRPTPGPHARWRISAETLSATRSNLPAVLAEFVGFTAEDPLPPDLREILALIK